MVTFNSYRVNPISESGEVQNNLKKDYSLGSNSSFKNLLKKANEDFKKEEEKAALKREEAAKENAVENNKISQHLMVSQVIVPEEMKKEVNKNFNAMKAYKAYC